MQTVELAMAQFDLCFFLVLLPFTPSISFTRSGVQKEYELCINNKKFVARKLKLPKA